MQEQKNIQQQQPEEQDIKPCLTCGKIPDINDYHFFTVDKSGTWGTITCCGGTKIRTDYQPVSFWKQNAIDAWNKQWGHKRITELEQEIEQLRARCRESRCFGESALCAPLNGYGTGGATKMICEICGNLIEDCECEKENEESIDFGDDERVWGYDGDAL